MNVLITGATSGVGKATAELLHSNGYKVIGTTSRLDQYDPNNFSFKLIQMDLNSENEIDRYIDELKNFKINILICNSGIGEIGSIEETTLEASKKMFQINYFGHLHLVKSLIPQLKENKGTILFLGSVVYSLPFPFKAQYSASKSALSALALSLRQEMLPYKVKVHLLEPGWIRSNFHNQLKINGPSSSEYSERMKPFLDHSRDHQIKYPDGAQVASIILKTLKNPKAKTRIAVGPDAKLFFILRRLLPWSFFESLFLNRY